MTRLGYFTMKTRTGEEGDEEDDDDLVDEDDDGVRHFVNLHVILQAASLLATHREPGDIVLYIVRGFAHRYTPVRIIFVSVWMR